MNNYTGHREVLSCDFGPRNGAENDILQCFELFFDKEITATNRQGNICTQKNTRIPEAIFSHLDHL